MDQRRVLLAVVLSFLVLYGYQALFVPPPPPASESAAPALAEGAGAPESLAPTQSAPTEIESAPEVEEAVVEQVAVEEAPEALVSERAEREVVVETATVQAVFSNRGAEILHWRLKSHLDDVGEPIDLIPTDIPADQLRPFALVAEEDTTTRRLRSALYQVSGDRGGTLNVGPTGAVLAFEYQDVAGLHVRKTFRLVADGYTIGFSAEVTDAGRTLNPAVAWGPGLDDLGALTGGGSFFTGNYVQPPQAIYHRDDDVERIAAADVAEQPTHQGQFRFAGISDHYFLAVAVNPGQAIIEFASVTLPASEDTERGLLSQAFQFPQPPADLEFYYGPKQFDLLRTVDAELVRAINFGIFAWLAVPLLGALTSIYGVVGNYGWSIVLLTLLINLVIFPLRHKSVVSMRKMQMLQPQMKAIQARYAGMKVTNPDRQKMNSEIMGLYREKGVNPASGCLPMLLTMPVLFAFYSLLSQAIEIRGAEFGLWITDLSQRDPYYVTPVLMGASMFWQQKITPTTIDPAQQRIMMLMPLMFSFLFLRAPSGLVLYWFVSQLWAIGQQYFTNWWIGPAPVHTVRPPAERRVKNTGGGKTSGAKAR